MRLLFSSFSIVLILAGFLVPTRTSLAHILPGGKITLNGKANYPFVSSRGGTIYLQLALCTPSIDQPRRRPLNLSIVLDRSGSMGDERKIDYAKSALSSLVQQLSSDDILSIVIYDDVIDVLRPAHRVGSDKAEILRRVQEVYPRGSTNLGGGMIEGLEQVEKNARKEYINRVILLSDGLANQGVTDPYRLNSIAHKYRSKSISLTTMGVGLDYNENLMVGLAEHGGGNYYFIESPHSIAHILRKEFNALSGILAQNAVIELRLGRHIRLKDVIGYQWHQEEERVLVTLGDLYSDNRSDITLELEVPSGSGPLALASGSLQYETDKSGLEERPSFTSGIQYTDEVAVVQKNQDMEAQAKADVAVSTRTIERAMKSLDEGNAEQAAAELKEAEDFLSSSPAASVAGAGDVIKSEVKRLGSYQQLLKDSTDARRAKKSIQYENYQTQKNKH